MVRESDREPLSAEVNEPGHDLAHRCVVILVFRRDRLKGIEQDKVVLAPDDSFAEEDSHPLVGDVCL